MTGVQTCALPILGFFENFVHKPCRVLRILLENLVYFFEIDAKILWKSSLIFQESHENLVFEKLLTNLVGFFENFVHKPCRVLRISFFFENLLNKVWKPWWVLLKICNNFEKISSFLEKNYEFSENLVWFFKNLFVTFKKKAFSNPRAWDVGQY